jgi:hypothetical protein
MRKSLISSVILATMMATGACASVGARLYLHSGPPAPRYERYSYRAGYVWQPGYYRWDGRRYDWVGGRYARAPRGYSRWESPRWERRGGGWFFIEGRWR